MVRKTKVAVVEHPRGGEGSVEFHHIVSEEELNGHGSMYAMAVLRPHSSVGWHQHVGNTEPYFKMCIRDRSLAGSSPGESSVKCIRELIR